MKIKLGGWFARLEQMRGIGPIVKGIRMLWQLVAHNFGLKVLSLLIAVLMWNFVISSDSSITRTKTVEGLTAYVTGQSTLTSAHGLALVEDPGDQLSDIAVIIEVSQAEFANVSNNNVMVTLDLSNARRTGEQELALKAVTSYGRIVKVIPSTVTVNVEEIDARVIPVNVKMTGTPAKERWHKVNRTNPSSLTIKGPASVVQSIASAYVYSDVTGARSSYTAAEQYVLVDSAGNEIPQDMLERSSSSISVSVDIYPTKEIPIDTSLASVITGQPAEGYEVQGIAIRPDTLTVAAEQELLDDIDTLLVEPVSVEGVSQSFSVRAEVSKLSSFKSISADEVYVNVSIAEETVSAWIDDVKVSYANKGDGLTLNTSVSSARVYVTGPRSVIDELKQTGFAATVDLAGLDAGSHSLKMSFPVTTFPEVTFTPEVGEIDIVLTR